MKLMITIGITVLGSIGGWLGAALSHGDWFSPLSLGLSIIGSFAGVWAGYKAGEYLGF